MTPRTSFNCCPQLHVLKGALLTPMVVYEPRDGSPPVTRTLASRKLMTRCFCAPLEPSHSFLTYLRSVYSLNCPLRGSYCSPNTALVHKDEIVPCIMRALIIALTLLGLVVLCTEAYGARKNEAIWSKFGEWMLCEMKDSRRSFSKGRHWRHEISRPRPLGGAGALPPEHRLQS